MGKESMPPEVPDEAAARIREANPGCTQAEANSAAWHEGKRLLERAINERLDFALESTLGGSTIAQLLHQALARGIEVRVWYVSLATPELHIARVKARVSKGGHDIPEADIRRRFDAGRVNLVRLIPKLTALRVYDNSLEADPDSGHTPAPTLVMHFERGRMVRPKKLASTPEWAKPLVAAALRLQVDIDPSKKQGFGR